MISKIKIFLCLFLFRMTVSGYHLPNNRIAKELDMCRYGIFVGKEVQLKFAEFYSSLYTNCRCTVTALEYVSIKILTTHAPSFTGCGSEILLYGPNYTVGHIGCFPTQNQMPLANGEEILMELIISDLQKASNYSLEITVSKNNFLGFSIECQGYLHSTDFARSSSTITPLNGSTTVPGNVIDTSSTQNIITRALISAIIPVAAIGAVVVILIFILKKFIFNTRKQEIKEAKEETNTSNYIQRIQEEEEEETYMQIKDVYENNQIQQPPTETKDIVLDYEIPQSVATYTYIQ